MEIAATTMGTYEGTADLGEGEGREKEGEATGMQARLWLTARVFARLPRPYFYGCQSTRGPGNWMAWVMVPLPASRRWKVLASGNVTVKASWSSGPQKK